MRLEILYYASSERRYQWRVVLCALFFVMAVLCASSCLCLFLELGSLLSPSACCSLVPSGNGSALPDI